MKSKTRLTKSMLSLLMTAAMMLSLIVPVSAATVPFTTAAIKPGSHTTSNVDNAGRVYDTDTTNYGTWNYNSDSAVFHGFTLGIPSDATITNISVAIRGQRSGGQGTRNLRVAVSTASSPNYSTETDFGFSGSASTQTNSFARNVSASGIDNNLRVRVNGPSNNSVLVSSLTVAVTYTRENYTVTYDNNGGTGSQSDPNSPYFQGATVTVRNQGTMAKANHAFAGWNTAADGSEIPRAANSTFTMGSGNVTLYAQWTPNTYALTVNSSPAGGGTATGAGTYAAGTPVSISATPATAAGYRFVN